MKALVPHRPSHIYISGRNQKAAEKLIAEIHEHHPSAAITFLSMDLSSMASVKKAAATGFKHDRLDLLMCTAGIMDVPPALSKDGYEIQFATNHLGHAMLIQCLLPLLLHTAALPGADVRVLSTSSLGYGMHPQPGICFDELDAGSVMHRVLFGGNVRYGQSKLANILYASELARRHPQITSVSLHPGVVLTDLVYTQRRIKLWFMHLGCWLMGIGYLTPQQGCFSQVWCATVAKEELRNGGFYYPVGVDKTEMLDAKARDGDLAKRLWEWTDGVLAKF